MITVKDVIIGFVLGLAILYVAHILDLIVGRLERRG